MASDNTLEQLLSKYNETPDSVGYLLRLNLAEMVMTGLWRKHWTQKQLADAAGMKESFIARIIHADSNCTFDVAGRLLFALNIDAELPKNSAG